MVFPVRFALGRACAQEAARDVGGLREADAGSGSGAACGLAACPCMIQNDTDWLTFARTFVICN